MLDFYSTEYVVRFSLPNLNEKSSPGIILPSSYAKIYETARRLVDWSIHDRLVLAEVRDQND